MAPAGRGAGAAQGRPPGQQRALERPPGLEGWKKPSSSSSVSKNGMLQVLQPPPAAHQPCAKQDMNTQLMRKRISHVFTQDMTT